MNRHPDFPDAGAPRTGGRFRNVVPGAPEGFGKFLSIAWDAFTAKPPTTVPAQPLPVRPLDAAALAAAPDASLFRLGHSTVLMKFDGGFWLLDPVFSERASPFGWAGPRRFSAPPIALDALPPLAAVVLSHDHYDHLDRATVLRLAARTALFVAPLGVGDRLVRWGVDPARVRQLDWWQAQDVGAVRLTAVPARHFSGRTPWDRNRTLWVSWVIEAQGLRVFFSGDTGYHADLARIGARHGPFDVTLLETGGYDRRWPDVHMQPEQTLQAHLDLGGRWLLPIHNGTFDLAFHAWDEPLERIALLAEDAGVRLATPGIGEHWSVARPDERERWWRTAG
jgi:L-ascorbate metabolism protein UlaG (beta-lactamase superfamily)